MTPALTVSNLNKRYGPVAALSDVSIEVRPNEILGLIGQNGSGKSTMLKILAGVEQPDSGAIVVGGRPVTISSPLDAAVHGIGMVFQEQSLIENLTVAENIFLGKPNDGIRKGWIDWNTLYKAAQQQLDKIGTPIKPDTLVSNLSFAQKQMVELAKVLALEELSERPLVVLFDEPTSVMSRTEIDVLFAQIRRLKTRASIVFVSHRMDEVLEISDRVYVMSDGRKVAEEQADATKPETLYRLMVGHEIRQVEVRQVPESLSSSTPRLALKDLSLAPAFRNINLEVYPGQILAICGVGGSGAELLCRTIFGIYSAVSGSILLDGKRYLANGPGQAARQGVGYLSAERKVEGLIDGKTLHDNIALTFWREVANGPFKNRASEASRVSTWMRRLKVKAPNADALINNLSGGNQQKVVVARWLFSEHLKLLIIDRPTRGLDPRAREDLYAEFRRVADEGVSIILIADTLDEALAVGSHIIAMRDGVISARFENKGGNIAPEKIVAAMV